MEEQKPRKWILIILIVLAILITVILLNKFITDIKSNSGNKKELWSIFDIFKGKENNFISSISSKSFNSNYERYTGTKEGYYLEDLFERIITNNKTNKIHRIKIIYGELSTEDPVEIKNLKQKIESGDKFEVSINYDESGYVKEIVLELIEKDMSKVNMFNSDFSFFYNGTEYGTSVKNLLDKVITNNQTNKEHVLTVVYNDTSTTDIETIRNIKKQLDKWTEYEVIYDYNEDGYIYQIRLEK